MKAVRDWLNIIFLLISVAISINAQDTLKVNKPPVVLRLQSLTQELKFKPVFIKQTKINELPLFCKWEENWAKSSKINLRFRIGSLDYVNSLEGK